MVTLVALVGLLTHLPAVLAGELVTARVDWIPQLGLNLTLMLDSLGFFFACLILGIGLLIIAYARSYLSRDDHMGEFFTYLLLFQGAMAHGIDRNRHGRPCDDRWHVAAGSDRRQL